MTLKRLKSIEKQIRQDEATSTTKHSGFRKRGVGISIDRIVLNACDSFASDSSLIDWSDYQQDRKKEVVQLNQEIEDLEEE